MKVLIVDDEDFKVNNVIAVLKENRVTDYCVATTLKGALEAAEREEFDLLVTDMKFPRDDETEIDKSVDGKNGFQLMLGLGNRKKRIPTIVYSTCNLNNVEKARLKELSYPFVAQICDVNVINHCLAK